MANGAKNVLLSALKSKKLGTFTAEAMAPPRSPSKRASPHPMTDFEAKPALKRAYFKAHGSVESLTSSVSDDEDWVDVTRAAANDYVFKPITPWDLADAKFPTRGFKSDEIQLLADGEQLSLHSPVPDVDLNNNFVTVKDVSETHTVVRENHCDSKVECAEPQDPKDTSCQIYCYGPVLDAAQKAYIYNDSKSFVDMKMRNDSGVILQDFENLQNMTSGNPSDQQVKKFVEKHFSPPGTEFENWTPDDWKESPAFLNSINDQNLKMWASDLNKLWKALGRKITKDVQENSSRYSMIYSPNPIIVPGGRFREFYYWDSYWVIRGLLLSEMHATVKGIIRNFLDMVKQFGFVPNGGRLYFTRRSQPPFLTLMVKEYVEATGDAVFLEEALPTLEREYDFWMSNRSVVVADSDRASHTLNRYASDVNQPRPESYREDYDLVLGMDESKGRELMSHITSACESGWDFSSRWTGSCYRNTSDTSVLKDLRTRDIIPVDLNSILAAVELALANLYAQSGDSAKQAEFNSAYDRRVAAMEKLLWHKEDGTYYDYIISQNAHNRQFFSSNVNPLWTKCYAASIDVEQREKRLYDYLKNVGVLDYPGGIPTSLNDSGEQWDFPNAWAPLVHMIIDGLASSINPELQNEAFVQSQKWINSNWRAYRETNAMFEKYDVTRSDGVPGGGGEYDVQTGFGWTNGVVMTLLDMYGDKLVAQVTDATTTENLLESTTSSGATAVGALALSASMATVATAMM